MAKDIKIDLNISEDKSFQMELKKFKKIFKDISKEKKELVSGLIENAAFMKLSLSKLKISIQEKGMVSEYQNGENQYGTKKSPEIEIYNTMIKNYSSVIKQLCDLLPQSSSGVEDDDLLNYLKGN